MNNLLFALKNVAELGLTVEDTKNFLEQMSLFMENTVHTTLYATNVITKSLIIKCSSATKKHIIMADIINEMDHNSYIRKNCILEEYLKAYVVSEPFETQSYNDNYILHDPNLSKLCKYSFKSIPQVVNEATSQNVASFKETVLIYSKKPLGQVEPRKMSPFGPGKKSQFGSGKKSRSSTHVSQIIAEKFNKHSFSKGSSNSSNSPDFTPIPTSEISTAESIENISPKNLSHASNNPSIHSKPKKLHFCNICTKKYSSAKAKRHHMRKKHNISKK